MFTLNYVPYPEMVNLSMKLAGPSSLSSLVLLTVIKLINYDAGYSDVCREVGILTAAIGRLQKYGAELKERVAPEVAAGGVSTGDAVQDKGAANADEEPPAPRVTPPPSGTEAATAAAWPEEQADHLLFIECLALMLTDNKENADKFRRAGGARAIYNMLPSDAARHNALKVIEQLILNMDSNHTNDDLGTLLDVMQSASSLSMRVDILRAITRLFSLNGHLRHSFRDVHGFVYVLSVLLNITKLHAPGQPPSEEQARATKSLLTAVFHTLAASFRDNEANRKAFVEDRRFEMLVDSLRTANVAAGALAAHTFEALLRLAGECFGKESAHSITQMTLHNPAVVPHAIALLPQAPAAVQAAVFGQLVQIAESDVNAQALASVETMQAFLKHFRGELEDPDSELHDALHSLAVRLGRHRISPQELREYLRLADPRQQERVPVEHLRRVLAMVEGEVSASEAPFVEFDMRHTGYSSMLLPSVARLPNQAQSANRAWPPSNGLTVNAWFQVKQWGFDEHPVRLLTLYCPTEPSTVLLSVDIDPTYYVAVVTTTQSVRLTRCMFKAGPWHNISFVFSGKPKLKTSTVSMFVNGVLVETVKLAYPASGPSQVAMSDVTSRVCARVGTPRRHRKASDLVWRVGGLQLFNASPGPKTMEALYQLGPSYAGTLQGSLAYRQSWCLGFAAASDKLTLAADVEEGGKGGGDAIGDPPAPGAMLDLSALPVPLLNEDDIWVSIDAAVRIDVSMVDGMEALGGRVGASVFAHEVSCDDPDACLVSLPGLGQSKLQLAHLCNARSFSPAGPSATIGLVGGVPPLLGIIADAQSPAYMLEGMRLLVMCLRLQPYNSQMMERLNGYQILSGILGQKHAIMTPDIVAEVTRLVHFNTMHIANRPACRELLLNFTMWREAPEELALTVAKHIASCLVASSWQAENISAIRDLGGVSQFLDVLRDPQLAASVAKELVAILGTLFRHSFTFDDLKRVNNFLLSTLPAHFSTRKAKEGSTGPVDIAQRRGVFVRNLLLDMLLQLCRHRESSRQLSEYFSRSLGPEWLMQFLEPSVDDNTVILALRIFCTLAQDESSSFTSKFKSSSWGGYTALAELLCSHCHVGEVYLILFGLLLGVDVAKVPTGAGRLKLASLHDTFQFSLGAKPAVANGEAVQVLLAMVRETHAQHYAEGLSGGVAAGAAADHAAGTAAVVVAESADEPSSSAATMCTDAAAEAGGERPAEAATVKPEAPESQAEGGLAQAEQGGGPSATHSEASPGPTGGKPPNPFESAAVRTAKAKAGNPFTPSLPATDGTATRVEKPANPFESPDDSAPSRSGATQAKPSNEGEGGTSGGVWAKTPWPTA